MKKYIYSFLLILVVTQLILFNYFFTFGKVSNISMYPTLNNGQIFIGERTTHSIALHRGDIIGFHKDEVNTRGHKTTFYIKRVVAIPGDKIIQTSTDLTVNRTTYQITSDIQGTKEYLLKPNEFFVLGDNYSISVDSRSKKIGIITYSDIVLKVIKVF